jgi:hypothetical protein
VAVLLFLSGRGLRDSPFASVGADQFFHPIFALASEKKFTPLENPIIGYNSFIINKYLANRPGISSKFEPFSPLRTAFSIDFGRAWGLCRDAKCDFGTANRGVGLLRFQRI